MTSNECDKVVASQNIQNTESFIIVSCSFCQFFRGHTVTGNIINQTNLTNVSNYLTDVNLEQQIESLVSLYAHHFYYHHYF